MSRPTLDRLMDRLCASTNMDDSNSESQARAAIVAHVAAIERERDALAAALLDVQRYVLDGPENAGRGVRSRVFARVAEALRTEEGTDR